jgi:hypothetical protein
MNRLSSEAVMREREKMEEEEVGVVVVERERGR